MTLDERFMQGDIVVDKQEAVTEDYEMSCRDYVVRTWSTPETGPITLTLPPVGEARGRFYAILARNADAVNNVTITDDDDSECWEGDFTLDGKCDGQIFYSDGYKWWQMRGVTAYEGTTEPPTTSPPTTAEPQV